MLKCIDEKETRTNNEEGEVRISEKVHEKIEEKEITIRQKVGCERIEESKYDERERKKEKV